MNLRTSILKRAFPRLFPRDVQLPMRRLGSEYGGWWIPDGWLGPHSVAYLAGVGEDITFDLALMREVHCRVVGIDPTPRAISWVRQYAPADYEFIPVGLDAASGHRVFYAPANPEHVSHSMLRDRGRGSFVAQVRSLADLMSELGDANLDLLKLDIEGAQHAVIESMLETSVRPAVLCVEFDQPEPVRQSHATVRTVRDAGYQIAMVEAFNITFLHGRI